MPGVRDKVVIVTGGWGEIGCVVVVPTPGATLTGDDVIQICRSKLARFKVPKRVVFYTAEDLLTTPTGKVQKFNLIRQLTASAHVDGRPIERNVREAVQ